MKKNLLVLAFFSLVMNFAFAHPGAGERHVCFTDQKMKEAVDADPDILRIQQQLEDFTRDYSRNYRQSRPDGTPIYIIPVVFHILHNYGQENISDAQVMDAMRIINEDFNKRNADTTVITPSFQGIAADAQIEFRLANLDPNGNCTNGIDRIVTNKTYVANNSSKLNPWPNNKYINIWVANSLENTGAAAWAYLPGGAPSSSLDGIISRHNYVGSIGTASGTGGRTLTHELGHVLNLLHCWGSTNDPGVACGDDNVSDTPITKGFNFCPSGPGAASICNPPIVENWQNFMEYSFCDVMFTQGQKVRMHATLNSGVAGRNNLWTNSNLIATGVLNAPPTVCIPNADFKANFTNYCAGGSAVFSDLSWNSPATSWYWEFPGGVPSTSTDSNPTVQYPTAGAYNVTLIATNSAGSDTIVKTNYIRITGQPTSNPPFFESFEDPASFPGADGYTMNPDNGQGWGRVTGTGYTGTACIRINNYNNVVGEVDQYITRSFDFSNITLPVLSFYVSNAQRTTTSNDQLKVYGSLNCGQAWTVRKTLAGAALATVPITSFSYAPTNASQWRLESVNMNPFASRANVKFMFENISDRGNNTYIDDINITGNIVNIDEVDDMQLGFALYPNPAAQHTKIQFQLLQPNHIQLFVTDLTGRLIANMLDKTLNGGYHEFELPVHANGVYLVHLYVNGKQHIRRLMVSE
ncbi:MAG: T9SS C-terminal target domain-containing protein [Bacteroidetes bacterium]|nr:MAG: T9SS C-terminal target domain-containing protein [Bacteroidota bacterium]REK00663.1 MAG: T9SS C-terminal target domain-containing protein [Bacteroidota bacterium]REK35215.1 MAG: T9SS C-terminal target domain-containing protein [Bacteroidota bacterium]REK48292.1 MAG: T9SS C-terminal target domain-containing protein [Bacteroidota bacterium]